MIKFLLKSLLVGVIFGILDGLMHANPIAENLYDIYEPISRDSINVTAGIIIDIVYGFILCGVFLLLYKSLPGVGIVKGFGYGVLMWIFRVMMYAITQWMMFIIPVETILYMILAGLFEMLIIGGLIGILFKK